MIIVLQAKYWPGAKRNFQPIDIEYLSCECRKYYSYINGTKQFEGKNVFKPGKSPMLTFEMPIHKNNGSDVDVEKVQNTGIVVIAGGPCSGKTSLLKALDDRGFETIPETAETIINAGIKEGISVEEQRKDPVAWQMDLLQKDYSLFDLLSERQEIVLTDTSFIETLVFAERAGIEMGPGVDSWLKTKRYRAVFFLDPIQEYQSSEVRMESHQVAINISKEVAEAYFKYGYNVINVPAMSVA